MLNEEAVTTNASLNQVIRVCRGLCLSIKIIFVVICVFWFIAAGSMVWSLANEGILGSGSNSNVFSLILHIARGAIVVVLYLILVHIFEDTIHGKSPFTMKQVGRLKSAALALVVYAVLGMILGYCSALLQMNGFSSGYIPSEGSENVIMTIDFSPLIAAAAVFAFSYVFKYGVLLQELSDETL